MESASKRKAAGAAAPENEGRPSKRQKVPVSATPEECAIIVGGAPEVMEERRLGEAGWLLDEQRATP